MSKQCRTVRAGRTILLRYIDAQCLSTTRRCPHLHRTPPLRASQGDPCTVWRTGCSSRQRGESPSTSRARRRSGRTKGADRTHPVGYSSTRRSPTNRDGWRRRQRTRQPAAALQWRNAVLGGLKSRMSKQPPDILKTSSFPFKQPPDTQRFHLHSLPTSLKQNEER